MICPNVDCGYELHALKHKFVCVNCDTIWKIEDVLKPNVPWHIQLAQNKKYWLYQAFDSYPLPIAHEYKRMQDLLLQGQTYGLILQIKDMYEVLIKFHSLALISTFYHNDESFIHEELSDAQKEVLLYFVQKAPSLGDWEKIARKVVKLQIQHPLTKVLEDLCTLFNKHLIVSWRNKTIGHGALGFDIDPDFQDDIQNQLTYISQHFNKFHDIYCSLQLIELIDGETPTTNLLVGHTNHKLTGTSIWLEIVGKRINLAPFIRIVANSLYFFDSYDYSNRMLYILDYLLGKKTMLSNPLLAQMYQVFSHSLNESKFSPTALCNSFYTTRDEQMLQQIEENYYYVKQNFIRDAVEAKMSRMEKGIIHLQMERGMGKTTFAKTLDPLHKRPKGLKLPNTLIRTYYINSTYGSSVRNFISRTSLAFLVDDENKPHVLGDDTSFRWKRQNIKEEVASFLNYQLILHKQLNPSFDRLLFIVDGWDEINLEEQDCLVDLLPNSDMLHDGVYILITSRTKEELKTKKRLLQAFTADQSPIRFTKTMPLYLELLKQYVQQYDKTIKEQDVYKLIEMADARFLYLKPLMIIRHFIIGDLSNIKSIPQYYVSILEQLYGSKVWYKMKRLLLTFAFNDYPLTLQDIQFQLNEPILDFKLLALLKDLSGILKEDRKFENTIYTLEDPSLSEFLIQTYQEDGKHLLKEWQLQLIQILTSKEQDESMLLSSTEIYLIANIFNNKEKKEILFTEKHLAMLINQLARYMHHLIKHDKIMLDRMAIPLINVCLKITSALEGLMTEKSPLFFTMFGVLAKTLLVPNLTTSIAELAIQSAERFNLENETYMKDTYFNLAITQNEKKEAYLLKAVELDNIDIQNENIDNYLYIYRPHVTLADHFKSNGQKQLGKQILTTYRDKIKQYLKDKLSHIFYYHILAKISFELDAYEEALTYLGIIERDYENSHDYDSLAAYYYLFVDVLIALEKSEDEVMALYNKILHSETMGLYIYSDYNFHLEVYNYQSSINGKHLAAYAQNLHDAFNRATFIPPIDNFISPIMLADFILSNHYYDIPDKRLYYIDHAISVFNSMKKDNSLLMSFYLYVRALGYQGMLRKENNFPIKKVEESLQKFCSLLRDAYSCIDNYEIDYLVKIHLIAIKCYKELKNQLKVVQLSEILIDVMKEQPVNNIAKYWSTISNSQTYLTHYYKKKMQHVKLRTLEQNIEKLRYTLLNSKW